MNLRMGTQSFLNVTIPVLWGTRAILQDSQGKLSIIDLSGDEARLEIISGSPAPGIDFRPIPDGVAILADDKEVYSFDPNRGLLQSESLGLPPCHITPSGTMVGSNSFMGNVVQGFGVGLKITQEGIAMGAPVPDDLAELII